MTNENDTETIRYRYVKISLNVKGAQRLTVCIVFLLDSL